MSAETKKKRNRKEANPLPWVILVIVLIIGAIWYVSKDSKSTRKKVAAIEPIDITLTPPIAPPPPPPPPPKVEPLPEEEEEEMLVQEPVEKEDEELPDDPSPEPPSEDLGGGVAGGAGPAIGPGGGGGRIGGTGKRGSGSKYGWYAAKVQSSIRDALSRNPSTRSATMSLQIRIWPDSNGKIIRAQLVGSSGNSAVDQAIKNNILAGLQLPQAPPADMPTPIVLRISARKPTS